MVVFALRLGNPCCNSFGMQPFEKFGKKETTRFSMAKLCLTYQMVDKIKSLSFGWLKAKITKPILQLSCLVA